MTQHLMSQTNTFSFPACHITLFYTLSVVKTCPKVPVAHIFLKFSHKKNQLNHKNSMVGFRKRLAACRFRHNSDMVGFRV